MLMMSVSVFVLLSICVRSWSWSSTRIVSTGIRCVRTTRRVYWRCSSASCRILCWPSSTCRRSQPLRVSLDTRSPSLHGLFTVTSLISLSVRLSGISSPKHQIQALHLLIMLLPEANRDTLKVCSSLHHAHKRFLNMLSCTELNNYTLRQQFLSSLAPQCHRQYLNTLKDI